MNKILYSGLFFLTILSTNNVLAQVLPFEYIYAYPTDETYPIAGHHRDVLGKMFPVPGSGTLDTFYFQIGSVSSISPQARIRIFKAKIGPHRGPGYGPYSGGCQNWGYYVNTNDPDQGITPFKDAATDTNWVSTIGGGTPSFSPLGQEIRRAGGYLVTLVPNTINSVALIDSGSPLSVTGGDSIFVTMEIVRTGGHVDDPPNEFDATWVDEGIAPKEESESLVPTGIWKFYEHNIGTSFENVSPVKGWRYLTGGVDSAATIRPKRPFLRWWFLFHPTANVPPKIKALSRVYNTLSTGSQTVQSEIFDLNGASPSSGGVKSAWLKYAVVLGTSAFDSARVSMIHTGPGNIWQGTIPGQPPRSTISYWIEAVDSQGLFARTLPVTYQVIDTRMDDYHVITSTSIEPDWGGWGLIPTSGFFLPPGNYQDRPPATDNGTAGPFDLGGPFVYFGQTVRYAWIGVDGAIALTASPTDIQHVNSNGFIGSLWDIPGRTRSYVGDPNLWEMPKNFIAPCYTDLFLGDSVHAYGNVRYKVDSARFMVEWDSLWKKDTAPLMSKAQPPPQPSGLYQIVSWFERVILNRNEGTVEFQYKDTPLDPNLWERTRVGMQGEVSTPYTSRNWSSVNKNGYPTELQPLSNRSFTFYPVMHIPVQQGWNLVSAPNIRTDDNYSRGALFPSSTPGTLYRFSPTSGYVPADTLTKGIGYWLKFPANDNVDFVGPYRDTVDVAVVAGWNLIGSISYANPSVTTTPSGLIGSPFYAYSGGYYTTPSPISGKGVWLKMNGPGTLHIRRDTSLLAKPSLPVVSELAAMNTITVSDLQGGQQELYLASEDRLTVSKSYYDLPSVPPDGIFDARFSSGRMVETYSVPLKTDEPLEYGIQLRSATYPVTLAFRSCPDAHFSVVVKDEAGNKVGTLSDGQSVRVSDPRITTLKLTLGEGPTLPKEFALAQNYPNPFNASTTIKYDLPRDSRVSLKLFNILGQEVVTLVNEEQKAGYKSVQWNASNFASGVYFYRIQAGDFVASKKLLLLK